MSAPPKAPILSRGTTGVDVTFTEVPADASHAVVYLHSNQHGQQQKQFFDAEKKTLLAAGEDGTGVTLVRNSFTHLCISSVSVAGLTGGVAYTATVAYRSPAAFKFGPESPHSASITPIAPVVPCPPVVTAVGALSATVKFSGSPCCSSIAVKISDGSTDYHVTFNNPSNILYGGTLSSELKYQRYVLPFALPLNSQGQFPVALLSNDATYSVSIAASNGVGWSPFSAPATIRLADNVPQAPCMPVLEDIGEDTATVHYVLPACETNLTEVGIKLTTSDGKEQWVDNFQQVADAEAYQPVHTYSTPSLKINGLTADTAYDVQVVVKNAFGASPPSAAAKMKTAKPEVEMKGVQTQDDRDADLKKRAVDLTEGDAGSKRQK